MFHAVEGAHTPSLGAYHAEARFEQRLVVGFAVVGDQHIEPLQVLGEPPQERGLLAVIAHEKLAQPEARGFYGTDADQECVGARAAGQARGFGVEKRPPRWGRAAGGAARERAQQVFRQSGEVRDVDAAVAAVTLPEPLGFEVLPVRRADHFAAHELFDVERQVPRRQAGLGSGLAAAGASSALARGPFPVYAGDLPPQLRELFLDILHSLFLCP